MKEEYVVFFKRASPSCTVLGILDSGTRKINSRGPSERGRSGLRRRCIVRSSGARVRLPPPLD